MDNQTQQNNQGQQEKKEEQIDELDVIGGLLVKLIKYFVSFYRKLFKSQNY